MEIDIRKITGRPIGVNVKTITTTIHVSGSWVSLKVGKSDGWFVFNRILKSNKALGKKWYIGYHSTFIVSVRKARKLYDVRIPTSQWRKIRVKHYNFTNPTNIELLKLIIRQNS